MQGIHGANCRHSHGPGDGKHNPFEKFDSEENQKKYEQEQRQRTLERRIRDTKRQVMGWKTALDAEDDPAKKAELESKYQRKAALLQKQNKAYNDFCKSTGQKKRADRISIAKWDWKQAAQARAAAKRNDSKEKESSKNIYNSTVINPVVKTDKYRRLYNNLEETVDIQRTACERARSMLYHRSGTKFEDLTYINTINGEHITRDDYNVEKEVMPSARMRNMVSKNAPFTIISVHNHPGSSVPSLSDLYSAYKHKYKYGLIACHDGTLMRNNVVGEYNYVIVQSLLDLTQKHLYNGDANELSKVLRQLKDENVILEVFR